MFTFTIHRITPDPAELPDEALPDRSAILAAGLEWLYQTPQPADALIHHLGTVLRAKGNWYYDFIPSSSSGRRLPVVVVNVRRIEYTDYPDAANPLRLDEMDEVAADLAALGQTVVHRWNGGPGATTGSLELTQPAHASLLAAVDRYRAGCPTHKTVFCDSPDHLGTGNGCTWLPTGYKASIPPDVDSVTRRHT